MFRSTASEGVSGTVNKWTRFLGVSIRPWSGRSPLSLIIRGVIQVGICLFFAKLFLDLARGGEITMTADEARLVRGIGIMIVITLATLVVLGSAKILVGVLDLVPRSTFTGRVLSIRNRMYLDFLPNPVQRMIFERNGRTDNRKWRTEVVLQTEDGMKQWTVRNAKFANLMRPGSIVTLTVSPLVGYVANVTNSEAPTQNG